MARGKDMIVEKMMKAWKLSDDNKKTIKENAQKIKNPSLLTRDLLLFNFFIIGV